MGERVAKTEYMTPKCMADRAMKIIIMICTGTELKCMMELFLVLNPPVDTVLN